MNWNGIIMGGTIGVAIGAMIGLMVGFVFNPLTILPGSENISFITLVLLVPPFFIIPFGFFGALIGGNKIKAVEN